MSDRPSAVNGKRSQSWGTLGACPACGQCLCFSCHPAGPCVDDTSRRERWADAGAAARFNSSPTGGVLDGPWLAGGASGAGRAAGLRMRARGQAGEHLG